MDRGEPIAATLYADSIMLNPVLNIQGGSRSGPAEPDPRTPLDGERRFARSSA